MRRERFRGRRRELPQKKGGIRDRGREENVKEELGT